MAKEFKLTSGDDRDDMRPPPAVPSVLTFGRGNNGQLGHGDTSDRNVPVEVGGARFRGARIVYAAAHDNEGEVGHGFYAITAGRKLG